MNKGLYPKLAADNIRKNGRTYIPYLITCIGSMMMFHIMFTLASNEELDQLPNGGNLRMILMLGSTIIAFFSVIFLIYTNSFLMKRRKKEFGLFNILGMEKKHLARVLFYETAYLLGISLFAGLTGGFLLCKLMYMILLRLVQAQVPWGFYFSGRAVIATIILFCGIFIVTFGINLAQIHLSNPIELLRGSQTGEKEPKSKWGLTLIGLISLCGGYYLSVTTKNPGLAILAFFIAVILVMIGTYCLFISGSIVFLKCLRKKKGYYYKTSHFISVSGMIYRMKQNAAGLASICILSTAVLLLLSSTTALYAGIEDILRTRYPRNVLVYSDYQEDNMEVLREKIQASLEASHMQTSQELDYRSIGFPARPEKKGTYQADAFARLDGTNYFYVLPLEDYNRITNQELTLEDGELFVLSDILSYHENTITVFGKTWKVKELAEKEIFSGAEKWGSLGTYYLIVKDMEVVYEMAGQLSEINKRPVVPQYYNAFDLVADQEQSISYFETLKGEIGGLVNYMEASEVGRRDVFSLYAGLLFLGIFLGSIFMMAMVLIIYYKQVSEGYDDKKRFEIMQKVGLSREEIKGSIRTQILLMFFLPLVTAAIHIGFAFPVISRLLAALQFTNVPLFVWSTAGTILVFAVVYMGVFLITSRVYYRIVK